jgi:hypothetical protein
MKITIYTHNGNALFLSENQINQFSDVEFVSSNGRPFVLVINGKKYESSFEALKVERSRFARGTNFCEFLQDGIKHTTESITNTGCILMPSGIIRKKWIIDLIRENSALRSEVKKAKNKIENLEENQMQDDIFDIG